MTGKTEEEEFRDLYNMDVICIPTNEPLIRKDLPDYALQPKKQNLMH